jgi:alpha-2-macroglobulin-like protein
MLSCESCRGQLLEYLYDLLDAGDRRALDAHLTQCAACQAALVKARNQQRLLGAAAKTNFAGVRFEAPAAAAVLPLAEPLPRAVVRIPAWTRWALAAAVVLAVGGLVTAAALLTGGFLKADGIAAHNGVLVADAGQKMKDLQKEQAALPLKRDQDLTALEARVREQQARVIVVSNQAFQPGAPNEYQIQTLDLNDQPRKSVLDVQIVDLLDRRTVFAEKVAAPTGTARVQVPADLPLKPNSKLSLEVVARLDGVKGAPVELRDELDISPPVFVTHLTTDKPMYRPGETVRFRSLTLERFTLKPPEQDFHLVYAVKFPNGKEVQIGEGRSQVQGDDKKPILGPDKKPLKGVGAGDFELNPNDAGGEYTLLVREAANRVPEQQRRFIVQEYELSKLKKELDFTRKSFGPGEEVAAKAKATREDGKPVAKQHVEVTLNVDNRTYGLDGKESDKPIPFTTDENGVVMARAKLPAVINRGEASLSVKFIDDKNATEAITRPVPIVLKKLNVEFFPEGGWLVAGVPNRVYFQVRTTLGKPAELTGHIVDADGNAVVVYAAGFAFPLPVNTVNDPDNPGANQGMGVFTFTPKARVHYELKIDKPASIEGKHELPPVQDDGVAMSIPEGVTLADQPLKVLLSSAGKDRSLLVGAYCRGRLLDHQSRLVKKGEPAELTLNPTVAAGGVCRITVFEMLPGDEQHSSLMPRVERLVYRQPLERLDLKVVADKKQYVPGEKASLSLTAFDESGKQVPAVVLVKVVDKNVLTLADEKTARSMPAHFYLTSEVRKPEDLEFADFLLTDHAQAHTALDLLLGTQGWRLFAEQNPDKFRQKHQDEAEKLLVSIGQSAPQANDLTLEEGKKIFDKYEVEQERLQAELTESTAALDAAKQDKAALAAKETLARYNDGFTMARTLGLPILGGCLLVLCVGGLLLAAAKVWTRSLPYALATGACGLLILAFAMFSPGIGKKTAVSGDTQMAQLNKHERAEEPAALVNEGMKNANQGLFDDLQKKAPKPDAKDAPAAPFPLEGAPADKAPREAIEKADGKGGGKDERNKLNGGPVPGKPGNIGGKRDFAQGRGGVPADAKKGEVFGKKMKDIDRDQLFENAKEQRQAEFLKRLRQPNQDGVHAGFAPMAKGGGGFGGLEAMPRQLAAEKPPAFTIREFAHPHSAVAPGQPRSDFTETLFWHPVLVLDDGSGKVSFDLSDSLTSFEVAVAGHTLDGRIGAVKSEIISKLPFALTPTVPIEVTSSDLLDLPVSIVNNTGGPRSVDVKVEGTGLKLLGPAEVQLPLDANACTRRIFRLQPTLTDGKAELLITGKAGEFNDGIVRVIRVVPDGFPINGAVSDVLEGSSTSTVTLPETWIKGTLKVQAQIYPSTLADLQKGLEAMLREPGGCFEQTSTSNYPNLLILNYLKESNQDKPEIEARARDLLARGYDKLVAFECQNTTKNNKKEGYEWFGGTAPAHEALTAYGLLEFRDMAKVHPVDAQMVERTKEYLLSRKDGKGGFQRNPRALDTFGNAPDNITNAYIVWAITESGKDDDVARELGLLHDQAKTSKDPYFVALVANSLINRDQTDDAAALLKTLSAAQKDDGHLDAEKTSITGSGGRDLQIETTGLTILAWLKANKPEFNPNVQKAVKWIGQQRGGYGGFGSTQSTILALKALIAFAKANKKTAESGDLTLYRDDLLLAKKHFEAGAQDAIVLEVPDAEKILNPGKNNLRVEITGKNVFPYTLAWSYNTLTPASAENCPVKLTTKLAKDQVNEGDTVRLTATVENVSGKGQGMAVAIIGIPAGLTIPESLEQLKKHALVPEDGARPLISHFELLGRELVLYWRDLAPGQKIEVPIDLNCRVPGEYRGPASRAYLYYNADTKCWVEPVKVAIGVKGE